MSQKYTIDWVEVVKEGVGEKGPWKKSKMSLTGADGSKELSVSTFLEVQAGQELEGTVTFNEQYKSKEFKKVLEKPNFMKNKDSSIATAMKKKEESIEKFQTSKEGSIKLAGAQRDAVLLVVAQGAEGATDEALKSAIVEWRNWFLNDETFNNPPPFN